MDATFTTFHEPSGADSVLEIIERLKSAKIQLRRAKMRNHGEADVDLSLEVSVLMEINATCFTEMMEANLWRHGDDGGKSLAANLWRQRSGLSIAPSRRARALPAGPPRC
eukprot:SAG31_NODE_5522_length_2481_cov_1.638959_1_plen_110_part_00